MIHLFRSPQELPQPAAMGRDAICRNLWSVKGQTKATHFVGCCLSWSIGTGLRSVKYLQSVFYFQTLQESRNGTEMWTRLESRIKMLRGVALSLKLRKGSCPKWSNSRVKWSLLTLPCTTITNYGTRKNEEQHWQNTTLPIVFLFSRGP